jgi:aspartate aminotransferase
VNQGFTFALVVETYNVLPYNHFYRRKTIMSISEKIQEAIQRSSWIRKMFEEGARKKAEFGPDNVFDFSLGNPNLEPPAHLKKTLKELANDPREGLHAYMPNAGLPDTRKSVADYLSKQEALRFTLDDILMTVGAGGGLNVVLKTILDPGDEIIILSPFFMEYNFYIDNHQGIPKLVPTKSDFSPDLRAIEAAVTKKTKAVLVNSPNNPTGKVYSETDLKELGSLLEERSIKQGRAIYLVSDEPYRKIAYDEVGVPSIFNAYRESLVVTSFSKDLSLPGERIGYIAVHPDLSDKALVLDGLILCNRILGYVNAPAFMQRIVSHLLEVSVDIDQYKKKRDILWENLVSFGYEVEKPQGSFYIFPKSPIEDDVAFVSALQKENILTVPGIGFAGPGHFRIAYCVDDATIVNALPGFKKVISKFI